MLEGLKEQIKKPGGRKLFITLICLVLGTLVDVLSPNGLSANLMTLMGCLAGAFTVGNGLEHFAKKASPSQEEVAKSAQVANAPNSSGIEKQLEVINQTQANILNTLGWIIQAAGLAGNPQPQPVNPKAAANRAAVAGMVDNAGDNS